MISGRLLFLTSILATAVSCFTLGIIHARRTDALDASAYDAKIDAIRAEVRSELGRGRRVDAVVPAGTSGQLARDNPPNVSARDRMVREIKQELQSEMGLLPVHLLRDRRSSFVELYSTDNFGKTNYGTAGYLGNGYFVTVKHAVVALKDEDDRQSTRKITSVRIVYRGKEIPAKVVDTGDAEVEVTPATGRSSGRASSSCPRFASTPRSRTISPSRFSVSATTTRRALSSLRATPVRKPPTASSPVSPTAIRGYRAAAC